MQGSDMEKSSQKRNRTRLDTYVSVLLIVGLSILLAISFLPLALWLGRRTIALQQLNTGGILVLLSIVVCLRGAWDKLRIRPNLNNLGLGLLFASVACLWLAGRVPSLSLPLVIFAFCAALAAVVSFFFGELGVRTFLPALSGVFVLGLLVGLFPALDWPLRGTAAAYAGDLLSRLGVAVETGVVDGRPPELLLRAGERTYIVATECNGFGLLSSSLVLAAILAFKYRLPWFRKLGLLIFAAPTAIMFNMLRILGICLAVPRVDLPYAVIHEGLGLFFYGAGLGLIWWVAEYAAADPGHKKAVAGA